jgi:hypothetical protein
MDTLSASTDLHRFAGELSELPTRNTIHQQDPACHVSSIRALKRIPMRAHQKLKWAFPKVIACARRGIEKAGPRQSIS